VPTIEQSPLLSTRPVQLPRHPNRAAREVSLELRAMTMTLEVPAQHPEAKSFEAIPVNVLLVEEANTRKKKVNPKKAVEPQNPPVKAGSSSQDNAKTSKGTNDGKQKAEQAHEPIRWLLLTSLPIETAEQAWQIVDWYTYRWGIERFHYVLKQGCSVEDLQLSYKQRLCNAIATYSIVSCRLLGLMETSRQSPQQSCECLLLREEWRVLKRKFQPKNRSAKPPTLAQVVVWIAQLGGFMARKGDGLPGVKTLWRGLSKLHDLLEGVQLAPKT
jgi:Transposase Tn5 dimerisation domain